MHLSWVATGVSIYSSGSRSKEEITVRTIVEICGEIAMLELSWNRIDTGEFTQVVPSDEIKTYSSFCLLCRELSYLRVVLSQTPKAMCDSVSTVSACLSPPLIFSGSV